MKTKKLFTFVILGLIISNLFCSCGNLSRSKAKDLIIAKLKQDQTVDRKTIITIRYTKNSFTGDIHRGSQGKQEEEMLIKKGYIALVNDQDFSPSSSLHPFLINDYLFIYLNVGDMKDVNVTGITGDDKYKKVNYDIIYSLNKLGEDISYSGGTVRSGTMDFQKYDDGWRLAN